MTPEEQEPAEPSVEEEVVPRSPAKIGWFQRMTAVLFVIFCFEIGLFLLIYPWTDSWTNNYFAWIAPGAIQAPWHEFWNNTYVRGALSGVGVVNLWIALGEVFRMFSRRSQ
jgi:succinate dehydrogenase hydrophobic anchor subunit